MSLDLQWVVEDGADRDAVSEEYLLVVADELRPRLSSLDGLVVVLSGDLDATAARRSGESPTASNRSLGELGAKVVRDDVGHALLLPAHAVTQGADLGRLRLTVAHEAHHLEISRAGESTHDLRIRRGADGAAGTWLALAGIAAEEHRVDRSLQQAFTLEPGWASALPGMLADAHPLFEQAHDLLDAGEFDEALRQAVGIFQQLVNVTAYVAAAELAGKEEFIVDEHALVDTMIGDTYPELRDAFAFTPDAGTRCDRGQLDIAAERLVEPLQDWMARLGFAYHDTPDGEWFGLA